MEQAPVVSIIIVSYQVRDILRDCLLSIQRQQSVSLEVLLVDNASTDGTVEMVRSEFPWVRLFAESINHGFSPGNNFGAKHAKGSHILLLNPDTILRENALSQWMNSHRQCKADLSGPHLLNSDGSLQVSAWKTPGLLDSFLELVYLHRIVQPDRYPVAAFTSDFQAECLSGAALMMERSWWEKLNGLDPELFWMEDVDLCYRIRTNAGKVWYLHQPEIVHLGGQSSKSNYDRVISNQLLSRLKFTRKHRNAISFAGMTMILYLHVVSRIVVFHLIYLFNRTPKARAYRFSLRKLNRYLFKNDRSI